MKRQRLLPALLILSALVAVLYVAVGLHVPSARRLIFGVDKTSGRVRLVEQGITFLPWHKFYRLSFEKRAGSAQTNGLVQIKSREGVPVKMNYRLRFGVASNQIPDARRLVEEGWSAWIRTRVSEAVSAVTAQVPIEDFASPTSDYASRRNRLRQTVASHLARSGLAVTAFEIEQLEIDRAALLRYKRAELRRNARGSLSRVAVFGIEGLDWELVSELVTDGRLPNIKALIEGGATGSVQTLQPTVSPLLWATVATGLPPDRHGVVNFFDRREANTPVDARARIVPAVWEIAEAFSRKSAVVNWWTAWPPSTDGAYFGAPTQMLHKAIVPPELEQRVAPKLVSEANVGYQQIARFLNITNSEYQDSISKSGPPDSTAVFRSVLAKTWSDHRAGIELYQSYKPLLFMMGYEGTDVVNHLMGPYHPPYREDVGSDSFRRYWPTVANYYSEIDRLIGEWMQLLPPETTVIVMSAHGMKWGKDRPSGPPEGTSSLSAHRTTGVFIAYGQNVAPSRVRRPVTLFEIAPTLLALIGLPQPREMPGAPLALAFRDLRTITGVGIGSYQDLIERKFLPASDTYDLNVYRGRLQKIGHQIDPNRRMMPLLEDDERPEFANASIPQERWGLYAYFNNQAVALKRQGRSKEAVETLEKAIELNPARPTPYLNLAILLVEKQQYTRAEELFLKAVALGLPTPDKYFLDFAALYRCTECRNSADPMTTRAINILTKGRELFPDSYEMAANLGSALAQVNRYTEALKELERALALQPSSTLVLNNLGLVYMKKEDFGRTLDYWNRSLAIDPRQPQIREAATAVRSRL